MAMPLMSTLRLPNASTMGGTNGGEQSKLMCPTVNMFTVGHISLLCSPPFVPPIVEALGNRKVLISGIAIGLVGYAIGTYLGSLFATLLGLPLF